MPEPTPTELRRTLPSGLGLHTLEWRPADQATPATPFLLVHGLASNARLWTGVGAHLAAAGHPVVAVDQRGHGRSDRPDPPDRAAYTTPVAADDLARLLDELGWPTARLVGQSWGGNVVVECAARHPERCLDVTGVDGGLIELRDRFPTWAACEQALRPPPLLGRPAAEIRAWLDEMAHDWPDEGRLATMANFELRDDDTIAPRLRLEDHLEVLHGLWSHDPWRVVDHSAVPMRFLLVTDPDDESGRRRTEARLYAASITAGAPRNLRWYPGAHHDVHAQHPEEVAKALLTPI